MNFPGMNKALVWHYAALECDRQMAVLHTLLGGNPRESCERDTTFKEIHLSYMHVCLSVHAYNRRLLWKP